MFQPFQNQVDGTRKCHFLPFCLLFCLWAAWMLDFCSYIRCSYIRRSLHVCLFACCLSGRDCGMMLGHNPPRPVHNTGPLCLHSDSHHLFYHSILVQQGANVSFLEETGNLLCGPDEWGALERSLAEPTQWLDIRQLDERMSLHPPSIVYILHRRIY